MISTVTLTLGSPTALESIGRGDHVTLVYNPEASYFVNSIQSDSEWVLANLYVRRTVADSPAHILIRSWKDWGFGGFRVRAGYVVELEVVWMGDEAPSSPRVAVIELEES